MVTFSFEGGASWIVFAVVAGFLLFRPWVKSAASGGPPPSLSRYARHRVRRIMPAYVITVLFAYVLYHFREAGPNPGHTWLGLVRNLTLTQIYCNGYLGKYLHQGLTQMWSLAVEGAFYVALPFLAYLLLVWVSRRSWQPMLVLGALAGMTLISPAWLILVHTDHWFPDGARLWLPTYLAWFLAGMALAVLQAMGVRCYALMAVPLAIICYFIVSTPIAGAPFPRGDAPAGECRNRARVQVPAIHRALPWFSAAAADEPRNRYRRSGRDRAQYNGPPAGCR